MSVGILNLWITENRGIKQKERKKERKKKGQGEIGKS